MKSIQANGKVYCLKCVSKRGVNNSLARAGSKCRFGSQTSTFEINVEGRCGKMCRGRVLFCVLVGGNCPYTDQIGENRPKGTLHYTLPIQVISTSKISDEGQKVSFYKKECEELYSKNCKLRLVYGDMVLSMKKLSEENIKLVYENNKLSEVNDILRDEVLLLRRNKKSSSYADVVAENDKLKLEIAELKLSIPL